MYQVACFVDGIGTIEYSNWKISLVNSNQNKTWHSLQTSVRLQHKETEGNLAVSNVPMISDYYTCHKYRPTSCLNFSCRLHHMQL